MEVGVIYVHTNPHTYTFAVANSASLVRRGSQEQAQQWNTGSLVPDFGVAGSLPTLLQNTLRLQGTALSAVGRPGMENLNTTKKRGERMGGGACEIYVLIQFCGSEHFPNAFNTLSVSEGSNRKFQIRK